MKSAGVHLGSSGFAEGSRCLRHLFHAKCMMRLVSACLCWRDTFFFLFSAELLDLRRNCEKASHHNFKSKQQAVQGDKRCACFASVGPRSLRIGLQRVSQPNTTTQKLTTTRSILSQWKAAVTGPTKFTHFKSSGKITPIVIFERTAPSSCVRNKKQRQRTVHVEI